MINHEYLLSAGWETDKTGTFTYYKHPCFPHWCQFAKAKNTQRRWEKYLDWVNRGGPKQVNLPESSEAPKNPRGDD